MDLFQHVRTLAETATGTIQEGTKHLTQSIEEGVSDAAAAVHTISTAALEQIKTTSTEWTQQSSAMVDRTLQSLSTGAQQLTITGAAKVEEIQQQSAQVTEQGVAAIRESFDLTKAATFSLATAGLTIAESLKDLPKTAEALAKEMPKIAYRLRYRAGLRVGDGPRSDADVIKLFEKIPGTSKLGASETKIREFLSNKHGSHIISRQQGGANGANNIVWEVGSDNIRRGARVMTGGEQLYIRCFNAVDSIVKNLGTIATLGLTATGTAILTQAVVTAIANALDLYRGEITVEEFRDRIIAAAVSAGIATPIFFVIVIAVIALFPELVVLLSAPAVVAGFNALFGISIAVPIIQSLIRHLEAGGFGEEIANGYQSVMGTAQPPAEPEAGIP